MEIFLAKFPFNVRVSQLIIFQNINVFPKSKNSCLLLTKTTIQQYLIRFTLVLGLVHSRKIRNSNYTQYQNLLQSWVEIMMLDKLGCFKAVCHWNSCMDRCKAAFRAG